ncbi:MAG: sigma-70 family RNA polymerase sigma factor [Acidimicrobiales bacterium]
MDEGACEDAEPARADAAFAAFYAANLQRTVRQAALMVGSVAVAEDLAHDAMVELYHRWDRIENHGGYLYRCISHAAMRHLKRSARHTFDGGPAVVAAEPEVATSPVEFVEVVELLGVLTDRQRVAVVLKHYGDLSEAQIAAAMGCRPGTVGPLLTRAHAALRRGMGE